MTPTDPDMPDQGIRLVGLWCSCVAVDAMHDARHREWIAVGEAGETVSCHPTVPGPLGRQHRVVREPHLEGAALRVPANCTHPSDLPAFLSLPEFRHDHRIHPALQPLPPAARRHGSKALPPLSRQPLDARRVPLRPLRARATRGVAPPVPVVVHRDRRRFRVGPVPRRARSPRRRRLPRRRAAFRRVRWYTPARRSTARRTWTTSAPACSFEIG